MPREIASLVNLEVLTAAKNKLATLPSLRSLRLDVLCSWSFVFMKKSPKTKKKKKKRSLKQIDLRDNLLPASVSVSIVNDVRKVQALLETIDMV